MRPTRIFLLALAGVFIMAGFVWADAAPGAGITNTAHDFSGKGGGVGLCTFCHTPHKAASTRLLWNHTLSENTYRWTDVTATANGTPLPTFNKNWQGTSKNCLSCHDGSVAIGDILWFKESKPSILDNTKHDTGEFNIASPTGIMNGNHPVALPFPFNKLVSTYNSVTSGGTTAAGQAAVLASGWQSDPSVFGIRLFNDDGTGNVTAGAVVGKTGIECASCHDPHNGATVKDDLFLRGRLTGTGPASADSYICIKCHAK
jgi:hypothetical protein